MAKMTLNELYEYLNKGKSRYREKEHCMMLLDILPKKWRISAFCSEANIGEDTFYKWLRVNKLFKECYMVALCLAQEAWEKEEIDNKGNEEWDRKSWLQKGSRYFAKDKSKFNLEVDSQANPWEQYQQILKQAENGAFNASEIKQLMEAVNVGTRVYETFKLQNEVDKMKDELSEMGQRHGNDSIAVITTEKSD